MPLAPSRALCALLGSARAAPVALLSRQPCWQPWRFGHRRVIELQRSIVCYRQFKHEAICLLIHH
eukprot:3595295-Pleurochrysis_carterae.AAC.1